MNNNNGSADIAKVAISRLQRVSDSLEGLKSSYLESSLVVSSSLERISKSLEQLKPILTRFNTIDLKEINEFFANNEILNYKNLTPSDIKETSEDDIVTLFETLESYSVKESFTDSEADQLNEARKLLLSYQVSTNISNNVENSMNETEKTVQVEESLNSINDNQPLSKNQILELNDVAIALIDFVAGVLLIYISEGKIDVIFAFMIFGSLISIFRTKK